MTEHRCYLHSRPSVLLVPVQSRGARLKHKGGEMSSSVMNIAKCTRKLWHRHILILSSLADHFLLKGNKRRFLCIPQMLVLVANVLKNVMQKSACE